MALDAIARRRWLGVLALLAALVMLVGGQTVLAGRLEGVIFLAYWLVCFGFTLLAIVIALWDARTLRRQSRQDARALLHSTLNEIITDAKAKPRAPGKGNQPP